MTAARERLRARFELVVELHGEALLSYFLRRTETKEDAADLLSETFLTIWRRARSIPLQDEEARMWMFGVARNTLSNHRRSRIRHRLLSEKLARELHVAPAVPDTETALAVRQAISSLPPDLAELIQLVHWDGFTIAEVATLVGIPAPTARSRYARARLLLRTVMTDDGADDTSRATHRRVL